MKKAFIRFATVLLILIIAGFAFVHFSPDYNIYRVRSESMKPVINMGDMVITGPPNGPLNGEVKPGSIVTYQRAEELITHRVISVDGETLVTKGDAVEDPDARPVNLSNVAGVYLFKIPYLGYVSNYIRTRVGWLLVIVIPASVLVGFLIRSIRRELRNRADKVVREKEVMPGEQLD